MSSSSTAFSPSPNKVAGSDPSKKETKVSELQIVEAFSRVSVPESVLKSSNVSQLVAEMNLAKTTLDSAEAKLSALRQKKKESNFLSNMWNDQDDKIEDAQFELNDNVRSLSSLSSKLLILNTAMAKIMHGQQGVLQDQQLALTDQARGIEQQNVQIKAQQESLERNQREFNKAVEALAKATQLTHTQAGELMRCLEKVAVSEQRMVASYEQLAATVDERLQVITGDWSKVLANKLVDLTDAQVALDQRVDERLATSAASAVEQLAASEQRMLASHAHLSGAIEERLQSIVHAWSEAVTKQEVQFKEEHRILNQRVDERFATSEASAAEQLAASERRLLASHEGLSSAVDKRLQSTVQELAEAAAIQQAHLKEAQRTLEQGVDARLATSEASAAGQLAASEQRMLASHEGLVSTVNKRLQSTLRTWSATASKQEAQFNEAHLALDKRIDERLTASDASTLGKISTLETLLLELDTKLASIAAREATMAEDVERQRKALRTARVAHILGGAAIAALFLWMVIARSALSH